MARSLTPDKEPLGPPPPNDRPWRARILTSAQSPEVQLAVADFTMRGLHRQLRAAHRANILLGLVAAAAVLWGVW